MEWGLLLLIGLLNSWRSADQMCRGSSSWNGARSPSALMRPTPMALPLSAGDDANAILRLVTDATNARIPAAKPPSWAAAAAIQLANYRKACRRCWRQMWLSTPSRVSRA
jgi:hypothetical protein